MSLRPSRIQLVPSQLCVPEGSYKVLAAVVRDAIQYEQNPENPVQANQLQRNLVQDILDAENGVLATDGETVKDLVKTLKKTARVTDWGAEINELVEDLIGTLTELAENQDVLHLTLR